MKKVLSIVLLLTLVFSCVCAASAETNDLADTYWKISFMGQKTDVHFYDDNTVQVLNGDVNVKYTLEDNILSVKAKSFTLSGKITLNKAKTIVKLNNVTANYKNHTAKIAGTFTSKRLKPATKKVAYKKVKRNNETTLKLTFNEATEYFTITDKTTGEVLAQGDVNDGTATAAITFTKKYNKIYVNAYMCDKAGNMVESTKIKKSYTISCK